MAAAAAAADDDDDDDELSSMGSEGFTIALKLS